MKLRLSEPTLLGELVAHLREAGFLVAVEGHGRLEADLLNSVSERYDRERLHEAIAKWRQDHPAATVEVV